MGFFRSSYDAGRRVFPWILAGAAIFGTYKYSQYKADRERDLLSRLGGLEEDSKILRADYLERREQEAGLKKRLEEELGEMARKHREEAEADYAKFRGGVQGLESKSRETIEQVSREMAQARDGSGKLKDQLQGARQDFEDMRKELARAQWPTAIAEPESKTPKKILTKEERLKKDIILIDRLKDRQRVVNRYTSAFGSPPRPIDPIEIIDSFPTVLGEFVVHYIEWNHNPNNWYKSLLFGINPKGGFEGYCKRDLPEYLSNPYPVVDHIRNTCELVICNKELGDEHFATFKNGFKWDFPNSDDAAGIYDQWVSIAIDAASISDIGSRTSAKNK